MCVFVSVWNSCSSLTNSLPSISGSLLVWGRRTVNVVPLSGLLSTVILPFIMYISFRVMLIPSPVPSVVRLVFWLKREYSSKSFFIWLSVIPCPVSLTLITRITSLFFSLSSIMMDNLTLPDAVYLNAFESRLFKICLMRISSPNSCAGIFSSI
jgi:hypothetical protein